MRRHKFKIKTNQKGIVSLVVTMMLITVVAMIVLAFSTFTRREERQIIDRQLNSGAYYAAESGINEANKVLKDLIETDPSHALLTGEKDTCSGGAFGSLFDTDLDGDNNVKVSCLLIDSTPLSLEYSSIGKGESKAFPLKREGGMGAINEATLYWHAPQTSSNDFDGCQTDRSFPQNWYNNCDAGMLRIEIAPTRNNGSITAAVLEQWTKVVFVKPGRNSGDSFDYRSHSTGSIMVADCRDDSEAVSDLTPQHPRYCRFPITRLLPGIPGHPGNFSYYVRVTPLYKSASLSVCARDCATGSTVELAGAQAIVDSTGRASDIVRRIQARIGITGLDGPFSSAAVESTDSICKRIGIVPPSTIDDYGGCSIP